MYCEKCGNRLNEGDKFCSVCQNPVIQQVNSVVYDNSSIANDNKKAEGWRRVVAVVLDAIIVSPILFFIATLFNALIAIFANFDNNSISDVGIIFSILIWVNPMFIHSFEMFLFGNTLGNKIMKIQIKNIDGNEPSRASFGRQFLLSFLFFIPILSFASVIVCFATKQFFSDKILHLQAYKK